VIWPISKIAGARLRAAAAPPTSSDRVSVAELQQRLLALGLDDSPIAVSNQDGQIVAAWQLVGIPWATLLFRARLRSTWALHLQITGDCVQARARRGKVVWETIAATWMPRAVVRWNWPLLPDFDASRGADSDLSAITAETPRTLPALVAPIRACILSSGFAWEPVAGNA